MIVIFDCQRGAGERLPLTVWMDEQAIQQWHCQTHHGRRGRGFHYSDSAIETALGPLDDKSPSSLCGCYRSNHPAGNQPYAMDFI